MENMKYLFVLLIMLMVKVDPVYSDSRQSFFYGSSGIYHASFDAKGIDLGLGYRYISTFSGFDINVGGTWIDPFIPFVQGSYLFYPYGERGPYTGLGLSVIPYIGRGGPIINFPMIIGYQTSIKSRPAFAQFQYSVSTIPGATFSIGMGF
jgi:hypothetical protein